LSLEDSRAVICEPKYPPGSLAGLHGQRRASCAGQSGLRHGRMRQMNMLRSISRFLLVLLLALGVSCTPGKRITKANVEEVEEGMSKKQVESILGHPTSITNQDHVIMKKTTYVYRQGKASVTIVFQEDNVQSKENTLSS